MSSSYHWKLRSLLKKNLILMKRNIFSTIFEILFPILIIIIILALSKAFPLEKYKYEDVEGNEIAQYIANRSMSSINYDKADVSIEYSEENQSWLGLSALPPFKICSPLNDQYQSRPLIASLGIPKEIKNQMIKDSEKFVNEIMFKLTEDSFKEFNSVKELEDYIKDPDYLLDASQQICFGLKFSYDENTKQYDYSLHFFDYEKSGMEGVEDIPNNKQGMFDPFKSGPDFTSFMKYRNGAYIYMMRIVNQYILRKETGKDEAELNYGITAMKYIDYRVDTFGQFMGYMIGVMIVLAYMCPLSLYVYRIVGEKETKIKEGMKMMGMGEGEYFLSYFLQFVVINLFISLICAGIFKAFLTYIPYHFLFLLMFLWSLNVFSLIYFFQSFIDKTKIALVLSLVIYFMMYCVSLACMFEGGSKAVKIVLSILPQVCLNNGILLLTKFQYNFRYFRNRDFFRNYTGFSVGLMYLMFVVDFLLFL